MRMLLTYLLLLLGLIKPLSFMGFSKSLPLLEDKKRKAQEVNVKFQAGKTLWLALIQLDCKLCVSLH